MAEPLLDALPLTHARPARRPLDAVADEEAGSEARLARFVHRHRGDEAALRMHLAALPAELRPLARVVFTRELGPLRAAALFVEALGAEAAFLSPLPAPASDDEAPPAAFDERADYDGARVDLLAARVRALLGTEAGGRGADLSLLLEAVEPGLREAVLHRLGTEGTKGERDDGGAARAWASRSARRLSRGRAEDNAPAAHPLDEPLRSLLPRLAEATPLLERARRLEGEVSSRSARQPGREGALLRRDLIRAVDERADGLASLLVGLGEWSRGPGRKVLLDWRPAAHASDVVAAQARPGAGLSWLWSPAVGAAATAVSAAGLAGSAGRMAAARSDGAGEHEVDEEALPPEVLSTLARSGGGQPLDPALQSRLRGLLAHDFAHVRVHTDAAAARAAAALGAGAVTVGRNIYFGAGRFAPESDEGRRLLVHELTHVVQFDQGRMPGAPAGRLGVTRPGDAVEQEAERAEGRAAHAWSTPRRLGLDVVRGGMGGDRVEPGAGAAAAAARGQAAGAGGATAARGLLSSGIAFLVRQFNPQLADLVEKGPGEMIKKAITSGISSWLPSLLGGVDLGGAVKSITTSFSSAFALLQGARAGDARCCQAIVEKIQAVRELAQKFIDNPVFKAIQTAFGKVTDAVSAIARFVLAPAFDALKAIVGPVWGAIESVASTVGGWITAVKGAVSGAWDWLAGKLGLSGEGGVLDWLKGKASEIWSSIKETLAPVMGPLQTVGTVLFALSPMGQVMAIVKYGPKVVEAVSWMWAHRNDPNIVKSAHAQMGNTILPQLLEGVSGFSGVIKSGLTWLGSTVSQLVGGAAQLLQGITGIPILSAAQGFAQAVSDGAKQLYEAAQDLTSHLVESITSIARRLAEAIRPYAKVLCQIGLAIVNPTMIPMILAGEAWQWIPDCIKPPIIDLLLDAVIAILSGLPMLPMLGALWPLLKAGILGFLRAVRGRDDHTKITITNKLAKIISGGSPAFLLGFVKGLLLGVWDGIKQPFELIWLVLEGINKVGEYFTRLAEDAAHAVTGKPGATPAPAPAGPSPAAPAAPANSSTPPVATPSVITAANLQSTVAGITSQLNAQRPPDSQTGPGAGPGPGATPAQNAQGPSPGGGGDFSALASQAQRIGGELAGPAGRVKAGFWPAVKDLFSGGAGMSLDDLIAKMSKVWEAAKGAIASLGAQIANMICDFLVGDGAEGSIGEGIGYMVGMIAFQALLDYLSAGTWTGAMAVISAIAKFLNWPMKFFGEAMKVLSKLGGYILDGIKSFGGMMANAGKGALREVMAALGEIGTKLKGFAEELLGKFGSKAEGAAATHGAESAVAKETALAKQAENAAGKGEGAAARTEANAARETEGAASKEARNAEGATAKEAQKAAEKPQAIAVATAITYASDAGGVPAAELVLGLDALKARYEWIKAFEAVPDGPGTFEIDMIASRHKLEGKYGKAGKVVTDAEKTAANQAEKTAATEAEKTAASEAEKTATSGPKVNEKGRFEAKTAEDIKALREHPPQRPPDLTPDQEKLWEEYETYYKNKLAKMERELQSGGAIVEKPPSDFENYAKDRGFWDELKRGKEFQARFAEDIKSQLPPEVRVEVDVGMKKGAGSTKFGDVVVASETDGALTLEAYSCKQRDLMKFEGAAEDGLAELRRIVQKDIEEALDKYAGTIQIRRPGFPGYGDKHFIEEVKLVYDSTLVPPALQRRLREQVAAQTYRKTMKIELIFFP